MEMIGKLAAQSKSLLNTVEKNHCFALPKVARQQFIGEMDTSILPGVKFTFRMLCTKKLLKSVDCSRS